MVAASDFRVRGMTVLELAVVMVIIGILASMILPLYSGYQSRMEEARCLANLRNLYVAASGHLLANKSWPQIPNNLVTEDPKAYARAWVDALTPFGAPHSTWICPTIQGKLQIPMDAIGQDKHYRIDFVGSAFDADETAPRRDPRFPWFVERAGFHSRGNLVILADGTTTSLMDLVAQLK
jgi:prepilin-type N-terminal cleavage/methylation domain-containing protein